MRWMTALMLCGLLAACVPNVNKEVNLKMQRVGVISNLGPLHVIHQGTTIFTNENQDIPVPQWNLDAYAEARLVSAIHARYPNAEIVPIHLPASALKTGSLVPVQYMDKAEVGPTIDAAKVDTVVSILPWYHDNAAQYTPGVGLFHHNVFGMQNTQVYAIFRVLASDQVSGKNGRQGCSNSSFNNACLQVEASPVDWHEGSLTAQEFQRLEPAIKKQINQGIAHALGEMEW